MRTGSQLFGVLAAEVHGPTAPQSAVPPAPALRAGPDVIWLLHVRAQALSTNEVNMDLCQVHGHLKFGAMRNHWNGSHPLGLADCHPAGSQFAGQGDPAGGYADLDRSSRPAASLTAPKDGMGPVSTACGVR